MTKISERTILDTYVPTARVAGYDPTEAEGTEMVAVLASAIHAATFEETLENKALGDGCSATSPLDFTVMFRIPKQTVAAIGTDQAGAALLIEGINYVTGADGTVGVRLPDAVGGQVVIVKVGPGAALKVYPASGDAINAIAADGAMTVVDDVCFALVSLNATTWYSLPLLPS